MKKSSDDKKRESADETFRKTVGNLLRMPHKPHKPAKKAAQKTARKK